MHVYKSIDKLVDVTLSVYVLYIITHCLCFVLIPAEEDDEDDDNCVALNPDEIAEEVKNLCNLPLKSQPIPPVVNLMSTTTISVRHVPEQRIFTVEGADRKVHACRLFPHETCTCPAHTTCCHIIAAKRSIGINVEKRKVLNLTQLRRNARSALIYIYLLYIM